MTTPAEMQALLRFLSHDAKVPLATAMGKMKALQKASLTSPALIAKSSPGALQRIFDDQKLARQILRAAKRTRSPAPPPPRKRQKAGSPPPPPRSESASATGAPALEASLALPRSDATDAVLAATVVHTNRAPLLLAFALTLLAVRMPAQPLSARLSVAQAAVSAASRAKAATLGLGPRSAEAERGPHGQPTVRVMGREILVMRRERTEEEEEGAAAAAEPALWGLDLDSNAGPLAVHSPQSARAYLFKSFLSPPANPSPTFLSPTNSTPSPTFLSPTNSTPTTTPSPATPSATEQKARNLGLVLRALELLFASWGALSGEELDARAWGWYVAVRPGVREGPAGWGGKADVHLKDILALRRGA